MNIRTLKERIEKYDVVTFDIFDTLVFRNISSPKQLFYFMEHYLCQNNLKKFYNFAEERIRAEKKARKLLKSEEITLNEIYSVYKNKAMCTDYEINKLVQLELNFEVQICTPNCEMLELYEFCIEKNKNIYLISDMYLDIETIIKILKKCNFEKYNEIFLSSQLNATKHKGDLYEYLLKDVDLNKSSVIHIGDNFKSDYIRAKQKGISAYWNQKKKSKVFTNLYEDIINNTSLNLSNGKNYWEKIGYEVLGPLLFGFTSWVARSLERKNYDHIFFLSRDAYLVYNAMHKIGKPEIINKSKYIYISRRSVIIPTLWTYATYKEICRTMFWKSRFSIKEFVENFGLEYKKCETALAKFDITIEKVFYSNEVDSNLLLIDVFNVLENEIRSNSFSEYLIVTAYFKQVGFEGNSAIIDSGWHGNIQNAFLRLSLQSNIKINLDGYYIGIRDNSKFWNSQNMFGYLFDNKSNKKIQTMEEKVNVILEEFFSCNEGSVYKYKKFNDEIIPDLYENERSLFQLVAINDIHNSALRYVETLNDMKIINMFENDANMLSSNLFRLGLKPKLVDAINIGKLVESNWKSILYLIFNPRNCLKEFLNSKWKIGFLKRCLLVKITYYNLIIKVESISKWRKYD